MSSYPFAYELRMKPDVERVYVNKKSELTDQLNEAIRFGGYAYRTQALVCGCVDRENVRCNGGVVLNASGELVKYVIRCNACAPKIIEEVLL